MTKPHYFYKVSVDKKVARDIQTFMYRCQDAEQTALNWARKQGAEHYYESPDGMAGGVGAVEFADTTGRDGWDRTETPDGRVLFSPMEGTDLEKEMAALPIVSEAELIGILNLQPKRTKENLPLPMSFGNRTPIVFLHHGFWYIDVPYVSADMTLTQIEEKEFYRRKMAVINEQK
nr:MAG TPA: hypothetical protein [Caudoviricetes sp.]